ncbi:unnamed protein product [Aphanomyces euteiches]|uniref:Uncharacterized protein n=1 Tax=Aphanomyces euteiches TaxID=100861 RepID=A0A6G0X1G4_9STRA|nr:hypothetical protein Ae201684_009308 [Aphanomyces euteiches]KAH9153778.1 hypothetical protein AeRB84_004020 [Aphanomyces euteiches]
MHFYQRPDLNGAGNFLNVNVKKKCDVPVQLILPDDQFLLGFPPASDISAQPVQVDTSEKAVFMTNAMRKHPQVYEAQILFTLLSIINVAFTLSFVKTSNSRDAWFNTNSFSVSTSTEVPPAAIPTPMLLSVCASIAIGLLATWRKYTFLLRLYVLYTFIQGLLLTQCMTNFLVVLRFPLDIAMGLLAHRIHSAASFRWFVAGDKLF